MRRRNRREAAGDWIDGIIPPALQRAIVSAVTLAILGALGLKVDTTGEKADDAARNVQEIVNAVSNMQERSYAERRKTWTLSNDLSRIESKVDVLLERGKE